MNRRDVYDSPEWDALRERVRVRDRNRCVLAWLLGGSCDGSLHFHHVEPIEERPDLAFVDENVLTTCAHHHPMLEALRRAISRHRFAQAPRRCPHRHTNRAGREACESALNSA